MTMRVTRERSWPTLSKDEFVLMTKAGPLDQGGFPKSDDFWQFLRAVLGNLILLLLLVGAERLLFEQGYYSSLIQHPFWIVILIAAVHDGLFVGVLIAVASTFLMDWPTRPAEIDITTHYIQVAILPLQWLLAALCIGLFRQAELRRAIVDAAEMARLQQVNEVLAADIMNIEAQMTRTQLETLMHDQNLEQEDELFSRILTLQGADIETVASHFGPVVELCTYLPATILLKISKGEFEPLDADPAGKRVNDEPPFNTEQMQVLRTMSEIIMPRTAPIDRLPEYQFRVVVGVVSPDRRTLYGAVELLAVDRKSAEDAVISAKFLAIQLIPVLARIRRPTIAANAGTGLPDNRMRKRSHG